MRHEPNLIKPKDMRKYFHVELDITGTKGLLLPTNYHRDQLLVIC